MLAGSRDPENLNATCCDLGLSDAQENDLVAFLKTLTDETQPP
jgi:hypothetical protein